MLGGYFLVNDSVDFMTLINNKSYLHYLYFRMGYPLVNLIQIFD